ncbi:hypothetical protein GJ629_07410 [Halapricum sp. CBA1109]|uniref:helix-turn-helix domain-containing protein n=1 Tax=Halapricum sp. CBA1109 TaxID=2668068 RepID=UPI0012FB77C1|nr:hypothetical protein [Halapricum sp. CBA1109]
MSLVVEFRIRGPPIHMPEAAAEVPDVTVEIEQWRRREDTVLWYLWASGEDLDRVTQAFAALPNVDDAAVITDGPDRRLYRITMSPAVSLPPEDLFLDGTLTGGSVEPDCLHLTARVTGRDIVTSAWEYLRTHDIDVSVQRLTRATADHDRGRLTDAQFDALVTAYEMGYFEEGRQVTQADVAAELGICRSSLSERLRRAQQELVEHRLGLSE